jgi:O-antigen chain-terminating methyltransferase
MRDARREISVLRGLVARLSRRLARVESHNRADCGLTDDQYGRFEEAFRGPFDDVAARLAVYLPLVENGASALGTRRVLDLGCGRGEWLQILDRAGYAALGVDERPNAVAACRALGVNAVLHEAVAFVRTQPADAWTVVSAFHLVEHIATGRLLSFFLDLYRVLQPGGTLLVETPNLSNVIVGSCSFHLDPTHQRPLPPELWQFLLSSAGFTNVGVMPLNPSPRELAVADNGSAITARFNDLFYGPRVVGLIARKPTVRT